MHLLRYVAKCAVTDALFTTPASCLKCPPAWIHFLTCVTRELVNLGSTAALRICWSSSSPVFTLCAYTIAFM